MSRKIAVLVAAATMLALFAAPASAGRGDVSLSLTKTVTTEPGTCGTESAISVTAGTTVYYCYAVTNTGDYTLDLHFLEDDKLGLLVDGLEFALEPGASVNTVAAGLTIDAVITQTTTNEALWEACEELLQPASTSAQGEIGLCATDTAMATVTVVPPTPTTPTTAPAPGASPATAARATPTFTG
jgi:hypothetical protein